MAINVTDREQVDDETIVFVGNSFTDNYKLGRGAIPYCKFVAPSNCGF